MANQSMEMTSELLQMEQIAVTLSVDIDGLTAVMISSVPFVTSQIDFTSQKKTVVDFFVLEKKRRRTEIVLTSSEQPEVHGIDGFHRS